MKRFQLFILSVFIMLLWSQKTIAVSQYEYGVEKLDSGVWYSVFTSEKTLGENFNFYYNYPSTSFSFEAKGSRKRNIIGQWKYHYKFNVCHSAIPNNKSAFFSKNNTSENENFNWGESTSYETNKTSDNYNNYKWFNTTINSTDARCIVFIKDGDESRYIKNIKVKIAPHTKLNTTSLSFNTAITDPATNPDGESQTIDFYSFLSGSNGIQISIVNVKDKNGNPITIDSLSLSKTSITADTLEKIGENNHSFSLSFKPTQIIENATCSIKIENKGAAIGSKLYIPVTLNSSLATPTLTCNEFGYKYAKLSWTAVEGAEKYNLYDGNTLIDSYTTTSTTITGLAYGSSHSYSVSSVVGSAVSNKSTAVNVTCPSYPIVKNLTVSNIEPNRATISWNQEERIPNHSYIEYQILVYENGTLKTNPITTTNTTITLNNLTNNTSHKVKVGVKYQYELNGTQKVSPDKEIENQWVSTEFKTKDPLTESPYNESYIGVLNYTGVWYYVNLNNEINITSNPMPIKPGYPCNYLTFIANAAPWTTGNIVGVKENGNPTYQTTKWDGGSMIATDGKGTDNKGETKILTTTTDLSIYYHDGNATEVSPLNVKNIWLTIEPHILLKESRYLNNLSYNSTKTATITADIDFGDIEIDENKQVNVNFKSFLSVGNITAEITEDTENVFSLKDGKKEQHIANNNTLEDIYSNDHSFTITFTPNKAKEDNYSGKLIIKDDKHTVEINLKGKCIKRTPEITWIDDKYISLGEYLAGAASSTCGTVKYELVDETKSNIIGIDNDLNLLKGKGKGEVEIRAIVDESEKWNKARSTATFTVTDKIIQAIKWNQDFTTLRTINEIKELTAKAITRETGEENGNEITYSIEDESVAKIIEGNKLQVIGSGATYITAHQQGNDEYAPTYMTKLVFVIETAGESENCLALEDITGETFGDGNLIPDGFNWGPFEFERNLTTLGDKLSFKTTKATGTTGDYIIVTDDLGNLVHNGKLGTTETNIQLLDPEAQKLIFTLGGNLKVSISDIKVTPAKYITPDKNSIAFSETKVDNRSIEEIDLDWANQSDLIIATIENDEAGVFSIDNQTAIFGNPECGKYGTSTVKVIFSPKEETNYTANLVIYVGDKPEPQKIPITGQGKKAEQTIYWLNITNLTTADKEINLAHTSASTQQPITYTIVSTDNNVIQLNENGSITVIGDGKFTLKAQQLGNNSYLPTEKTEEKEFSATIGNLIFDNKEKNNEWTTIRNWKPDSRLNLRRNIAPNEDVEINLSIAGALKIKNNTEIETEKQLSISETGTITIEPQGKFKVNTISGATADNLTLKASDEGNATFVYKNGEPNATVEMYSKASGGVAGGKPEWQYMGVAVNNVNESNCAKASDFSGAWLLKWEEKDNITGDPWSKKPLVAETTLLPWAGYSITQPQATVYQMRGQLMNDDHTYTLTHTTREGDTQDPDCGFNLLANSYTAPIDITKLTEDDFVNADACIILYNTGTYAQWESQQKYTGEQPGQLTVIPVVTGEVTNLTTTIASMQAFFVKANENNATFIVDYERAVLGATNMGNQMRAPQARDEFNVLKIMIEGENTRDRLYLLENENTTNEYDNGYEARKIFDAPRGHQMYATCQYGYASIDCSESFIGQTIGLKGDNDGEMLTISFDTERLDDYESLYLYDKTTGKYVNIIAGEEYTFFGIKGADDNRFSIVTNPDDENQTPPFVVIGEELAFDKSQIDTDNANIYIYDTSGRLLITDKINPYENYNIPNIPKGIYLVSMNGYTTKIVKK